MIFVAGLACFILSLIITPFVKKVALRIGATDKPSQRKVHVKLMPRLGGLAIFSSFIIGFVLFSEKNFNWIPIIIGLFIITLLGVLDDKFELPAKIKFGVQLLVAIITVIGGIQIEFITIPFLDRIEFGYLSIPITILWIVGVTNAINLIDGLDGLAAGVSSIALLTISGMAISLGNTFVALLGIMLLSSTLGFLVYNFYPAKIFMGDTGSLLLGYMISVLSLMGLYKNVTFFSLLIPVIILGVPLLDTFFAIIRRIIQRKPLSAPDKLHLHHCLLGLGYSHRQTVLLIYAISGLFSVAAIIFSRTTMWGSTITIVVLLILTELIVESTGLIDKNYRPLLKLLQEEKLKINK
ncbi:undecaprenyl/decaprenyl-phosphate alpha-N-acetylglucosaminyl 1-phosphate transferase [Radiobacillus kanasensis]|uniref:glycosyltransferase family 4 protein n=1 Tax=Radiobacillus kanasensis TaxID=2844358 RepID=UPI001E393836|nr:MraY family glycosyltransferase [Radiobacillus kanasensis]UFT98875.1 undecaprenyl/decaprenyl-phosphate alpha-N-acetylglucosaminyl 1-phosphate transferase [Radiobacillus kanasensis]